MTALLSGFPAETAYILSLRQALNFNTGVLTDVRRENRRLNQPRGRLLAP